MTLTRPHDNNDGGVGERPVDRRAASVFRLRLSCRSRFTTDPLQPFDIEPSQRMSAVSPRSTFYSPSGLVPFAAWLLVAILLVPVAALGGVVYSAAIVFVPLVKFRWVGSVGLGWAIGVLAAKICRWGKVRSQLFAVVVAVLGVLVAYYAAWGIHRSLVIAGQVGVGEKWAGIVARGFLPGEIVRWMASLYRGGNADGIAGLPLIGVWLVELGAIAYSTRTTFQTIWDDRPFCESCDVWNGEPEAMLQLPVSPSDPAWQQVSEGWLDAIRKLKMKEDASETVSLSLSSCPQCDRSHYLSASGFGWETTAAGEVAFKEVKILRHMAVTPQQIGELKELGELLDEAYRELNQDADAPSAEQPTGANEATGQYDPHDAI